jgi:hypothetical protein
VGLEQEERELSALLLDDETAAAIAGLISGGGHLSDNRCWLCSDLMQLLGCGLDP